MKHTKEEVIAALKVIRDECTGTSCEKCPFGTDDYECVFERQNPDDFEIIEKDGVWRVLR